LKASRKTLRQLSRLHFIRSLRFRLTVGFLLFFTLMLTGVGLLFRQMLISIFYDQATTALEEEWGASKGYLRFEHQRPIWMFDRFDPEESVVVNRIRRVYLITDATGNQLELSEPYRALGVDSLDHIQAVLKSPQPVLLIRGDDHGTPYLIRQGAVPDDRKRLYFVAIGRSLADSEGTVSRFSWRYVSVMPLLIVLSGILGWALAGRGLRPVNQLANTAHNITSSNLNLQIPLRNAGDELDELIEAFNRMIERLNLSFEQMRQFSTDVSHELRTPLTAIRGQLEVALFTAKTTDQYQDAMVNALQDVEQLSNIVRALLLLSQAESGQLVLQMVPLDLAQVVDNIADQYQIPAEAAKIELRSKVQRKCIVRADKTQMERLISNLLSNAIKYTPEGGRVDISLTCGMDENAAQEDGEDRTEMARLIVEDTGIGIPAAKLPHIFDRFYRVRPSHTNPVQGLGLGLSFVSWIVSAHGGRIDVESKDGQGSRFTVLLPLASTPVETQQEIPVAVTES
jgi:heavy metal sensor kinase